MICKRCGYTWNPRVRVPKACPNCKSFLWGVNSTEKLIKPKKYRLGECVLCERQNVRLCRHHLNGKHGAINPNKVTDFCFRCHGIIGRYHHFGNNCLDDDIKYLKEKLAILLRIKELNLVEQQGDKF